MISLVSNTELNNSCRDKGVYFKDTLLDTPIKVENPTLTSASIGSSNFTF